MELVNRFCVDILMGFGGYHHRIWNADGKGGADHHVWYASKLQSNRSYVQTTNSIRSASQSKPSANTMLVFIDGSSFNNAEQKLLPDGREDFAQLAKTNHTELGIASDSEGCPHTLKQLILHNIVPVRKFDPG
jgi:hypothetical protein